jgi:NAD(P)-dependent dehydrogenase (short-subunit alcohol dehydrogenase family)
MYIKRIALGQQNVINNMPNVLADETVIIIGGTSGIGLGVAKHVLQTTEAKVVIASSTQARVNKTLSELPADRSKGYVLELSDKENLPAAVTALYDKIGKFHHLVFTAGDGFNFMTIDQYTRDVAEKIFDIRYWGLLECIKHAVPRMPKSRFSSITFTSATMVNRPSPGWVLVGSGVCGALDSLGRGLAIDLAPIRVNCVLLGVVDTDLWGWLEEDARAAFFEDLSKNMPTGTVGTPEEVAEAYAYLMKCSYVTGQSITVDGGKTLV